MATVPQLSRARPDGAASPTASCGRVRETADTWTLRSSPLAASRSSRPGPVQHALRLRGRRGPDLDRAARRRAGALVHTIRAVGAGDARALRRASRARCSACAARSARLAGGAGGGRRPVVVAGGIGLAPAPAGRLPRARPPRRLRRVSLLFGARTPATCSTAGARAAGARGWTSTSASPSTRAGADWRGRVGVVTRSSPRAAFDPATDRRVRLRAGDHDALHVDALLERGVAAGADLRLDGAEHEVRRRPLRPLPARPDARLPGRAGVPLRPRSSRSGGAGAVSPARSPSSPSGSSPRATAASSRCSTARTSCSRRRRGRDRLLPRGDSGDGRRARTTSRSSRARSRPPHDAERIQRGAARSRRRWSRSAPAPPRAASRRCATSPTSKEFISLVYATPGVHLDARHLDADRRPRAGRLRAARLPDRQAPAARGAQRFLNGRRPDVADARACAWSASVRGNVCVMVAHGTPCLGRSRTPAAARSARPTTAAATAASGRWRPRTRALARAAGCAASACARRRLVRVFRTFNANAPAFREESERMAEPRTRDDPHRLPGARRGRGRAHVRFATARSSEWSCGSSSRLASSRRSCAAARSPRRPTSPRASAASARSPTR